MSWIKRIFTINSCDCYKLPLNSETHVAETDCENPLGTLLKRMKNWAAIAVSARQHAGPRYYIAIAVVLFVITLIEIFALDWRFDRNVLATLMLVLGLFKFILVVAFYMHLKFDNRFYAILFASCMVLGLVLFIAVILLTAFYGS